MTLHQRSLAVTLVTLAVSCACPGAASADHCLIDPFTINVPLTDPKSLPVDISGAGQAGITFSADLPAAPADMPSCHYEISDVTSVVLTFTYTGIASPANIWSGLEVSVAGHSLFPAPGAITSAVASTYTFKAHSNDHAPGDLQFNARNVPAPKIVINLTSTSQFTLTGATAEVSGHHYYVPEPSSLALCGLGALVLIAGAGLAGRRGTRLRTR